MTEHTPGPWTAHDDGITSTITAEVGTVAATVAITYGAEAQSANARLIAAAPEMLAATKELRATITKNEPMPVEAWNALCDEVIARADAAIAKAEGRP